MLVKAFARLHPEQVSALVLVDPSLATHEAGTTTLVERFPDVARDLADRLSGIGTVARLGLRVRWHRGPGRGRAGSPVDRGRL